MKLELNPKRFTAQANAKKRDRFTIKHGDNLEILRALNPDQFDSLVTDPPAGIAFMGKDWDSDKGGRDYWIDWLSKVLAECYRVMKPGAHGVVWALPKTSHWTAIAIENAGFEIVDCVMHLFGQGFPKSQNISKMIDKEFGAEREVIGEGVKAGNMRGGNLVKGERKELEQFYVTAAATPEAQKWDGWGTALKPSYEPWWLIRKSKSESSIALNTLRHGVGGINIDESRIEGAIPVVPQPDFKSSKGQTMIGLDATARNGKMSRAEGRFPANVVFSHTPDCKLVGTKKVKGHQGYPNGPGGNTFSVGKEPDRTRNNPWKGHASEDGTETVEAWECSEDCAVRILDEQSGNCKSAGKYKDSTLAKDIQLNSIFGVTSRPTAYAGESGGASRFFYVAKASKSDKGDENGHPTVKSTKLMEYLIKLVTPEGGTILDPFMGSGTTGVSAIRNDFKFFGIDQEKKFVGLAYDRLMAEYKVTDKKLNAKRVKK